MSSNEKFDSIDGINYNTPVDGGYGTTLGGVIKRINKIIRTLIYELRGANDSISDTRTEFADELQGIQGTTSTFPSSAITLTSRFDSENTTLTIPIDRKYNHGWFVLFDNNGNQITKAPLPWSNALVKSVLHGDIDGINRTGYVTAKHSLPTGGYAYIDASSTNSNITIDVGFRKDAYPATVDIPANSLKIKYELY